MPSEIHRVIREGGPHDFARQVHGVNMKRVREPPKAFRDPLTSSTVPLGMPNKWLTWPKSKLRSHIIWQSMGLETRGLGKRDGAVSYTHLTLPTNREV